MIILWRRKWQPTPIFLPGEVHGQRSPAGYCPWDRRHDWALTQTDAAKLGVKMCLRQWVEASWASTEQKPSPRPAGLPGPELQAPPGTTLLGSLTQRDTPSSPPTETSSFPAPQLSKLSCPGFDIISVFAFIPLFNYDPHRRGDRQCHYLVNPMGEKWGKDERHFIFLYKTTAPQYMQTQG